MGNTVTKFRGIYDFLSNFYPSPTCYPTVEHNYQAAKTLDDTWRKRIMEAETASQAKRLGRRAPMAKDWDSVKDTVMLSLLQAKFDDPELRAKLMATGDVFLIEGNDWGDRYWGKTWSTVEKNWVGENRLGQLLMLVRDQIRAEGYEKED